MSSDQSLEILRLNAAGEIAQHRARVLDYAIPILGQSMTRQRSLAEKKSVPDNANEVPDIWQAPALNHNSFAAAPEITAHGRKSSPSQTDMPQPAESDSRMQQEQANQALEEIYRNAPPQEINYDI